MCLGFNILFSWPGTTGVSTARASLERLLCRQRLESLGPWPWLPWWVETERVDRPAMPLVLAMPPTFADWTARALPMTGQR